MPNTAVAAFIAAGTRAGVAYVVPTGVGSCRQFHTFLQTSSSAAAGAAPDRPGDQQPSSKPQQSPLSQLQAWLRSKRPTWMPHMFSHVLIDADIAIQARVDYNRWA